MVRSIRGRKYAYQVVREGSRVRQFYLGRAGDAAVEEKIRKLRWLTSVPERFRRIFWDTALDKLDLRRHKRYVIARILDLGNLTELSWLQMVYPTSVIRDVNETSRAISEQSKNFWRIWFESPLFD